jgi:hypothetical protein
MLCGVAYAGTAKVCPVRLRYRTYTTQGNVKSTVCAQVRTVEIRWTVYTNRVPIKMYLKCTYLLNVMRYIKTNRLTDKRTFYLFCVNCFASSVYIHPKLKSDVLGNHSRSSRHSSLHLFQWRIFIPAHKRITADCVEWTGKQKELGICSKSQHSVFAAQCHRNLLQYDVSAPLKLWTRKIC